MSEPVELPALAAKLEEVGSAAFLLTVSDSSAPHATSVVVELEDDRLVVSVGRKSRRHLEARPSATFLWPAVPGGGYSLIVDGTFVRAREPDAEGGVVEIEPTAAILHRLADATGRGPKCVPVTSSS